MTSPLAGLPTVSELLKSAVGDGYVSVFVALAVGYLFAACVVFRHPSPFRSRVGGSLNKGNKATSGVKVDGGRRTEGHNPDEGSNSDGGDYPAPMPKGDLTVGDLKRYDGKDPNLPVLVAAKGRVYDVTRGRDFYGEGAFAPSGTHVLLVHFLLLFSHLTRRKKCASSSTVSRIHHRRNIRRHILHLSTEYPRGGAHAAVGGCGAVRPFVSARVGLTTVSPASTAAERWPR